MEEPQNPLASTFGARGRWGEAQELGMDVADVHKLTNIDRWFLSKLHGLHQLKVGSVMHSGAV